MTSFETRDIFKVNGDASFVEEVEAKCEDLSNSIEGFTTTTTATTGSTYLNESHYGIFSKPTPLDLENMGMAYGISGLYLQSNGMGSPSSPSEKLNGLTLGQMTVPSYAVMQQPSFSRAMSVTTMTSSSSSPVTVPSPPVAATNGMTRFGSQEIMLSKSTSPTQVLSPNSSDGKEQAERLVENGMKMAQEQKQYYSVMPPERGVDSTANFIDQVLISLFLKHFIAFVSSVCQSMCKLYAFSLTCDNWHVCLFFARIFVSVLFLWVDRRH